MKHELDDSDDHVDLGFSQATSPAASSSSQLHRDPSSPAGPALDFDIDDCDFADSAPDSDDEKLFDEPPLQKFLSIVLSLGTVGLAMVSALTGCD